MNYLKRLGFCAISFFVLFSCTACVSDENNTPSDASGGFHRWNRLLK